MHVMLLTSKLLLVHSSHAVVMCITCAVGACKQTLDPMLLALLYGAYMAL